MIYSRFYLIRFVIYVTISVFFTRFASAAEDYTGWTYQTKMTLDTGPSGANIASEITRFPILVRLSSSNFIFAEAQGNGQDIRFSKPSGAPLSYQIERWDSAGNAAEIWVKVDTLIGNTAGQIVNMHWGKALAEDSSNGKVVFDSADGYAGVWHLNEAGNSTLENYRDSSPGKLNGTGIGMTSSSRQAGVIGLAQSFNGNSSSIAIPPLGSGKVNSFTLSAWVQADSIGAANSFNALWSNNNWSKNDLHFQLYGAKVRVGINSNLPADVDAAMSLSPATWYHISSVYDSASMQLQFFINGNLTDTKTYTVSGPIDLADSSHIGSWNNSRFFKGRIDELEMSTTMRSTDWIKLAYANQKQNQTVVKLQVSPRCVANFIAPKDTTVKEGSTLTLSATTNCASQISWSIISGPGPKILDPESKILSLNLPRIVKDTFIVYRLTAIYADSSPSKDFRVTLKEVSPDPIFTLPATLTWNGNDSLLLRPTITNLAAIRTSPDSVIHWIWNLSDPQVDTVSLSDGLLLKNGKPGTLQIELCLDNGGLVNCKSSSIVIGVTAGSNIHPRSKAKMPPDIIYDAKGRSTLKPGLKRGGNRGRARNTAA